MERHPAGPDLQRLDGVLHVIAEIVEQHVADAAAEHDAERDPDEEIIELCRVEHVRRPARHGEAITPSDQQPRNVCERVPPDREGPKLDQDGIDGGIGYDQHQR